jgi:hypothetical protein
VVLLGVLAPVAGIGLLYLLRNAGVAHAGPFSSGALPLQQLDNTDAQPLARMALAWLPVGIVTGAVIATFTRSSWAALLSLFTLVALVVLDSSAGVSDSVANNESLTQHLTAPLGVSGTWVSLVLVVIGAGLGGWLASLSRPAPNAA